MDKKRQTIVLLHGALGTCDDLEGLRTLFEEHGFEALSFNFSGHGLNSPVSTEFRIDLFARDLEKFLSDKQLTSPIIFGYSMGGYVALYHKAHFENSCIKRIFTYGTKFNWSAQAVKKELPMLEPEYIQDKFPHFADTLKIKHGEKWKNLLHSTAHMVQNLERLDGLTREDLSEIEIQVIMILGDQDRIVSSEETHLTASWLHYASVKTVSHSKHELERSNLREIAEIVIENID